MVHQAAVNRGGGDHIQPLPKVRTRGAAVWLETRCHARHQWGYSVLLVATKPRECFVFDWFSEKIPPVEDLEMVYKTRLSAVGQ